MSKKHVVFAIVYFLGFGVNLFVNRFVFQNFSEEEYGKYSYFFNLLMIAAPIISLNVKDGVMRFYDYKDSAFWHTILGLSSFSFVIAICFSLFFSWYFISFFTIMYYNVILSILRGREKLVQFNIQRILPSIFLLALVYWFKPSTYPVLIFITGIGYLLSCCWYYVENMHKINVHLRAPIDFLKIRFYTEEVLRFTIPTILTALSLWAFNFLDQYIIKYYHGYEYLSRYAAAVRILNVYKILLSIVLVIFPVFYFKNYTIPNKIRQFRKKIIIGVVLIAVSCVIGKDFLYYLFGATKYLSSSALLTYLVIAESFRFISTIFLTVFSQIKKPIITTYIYVAITFISIGLNLVFVPKFGDVGAALVDIVSSILLFSITLALNRRYEFK